MNIAMKRKERITQSNIEAVTTKLSNQKYITQQLAKENKMVVHECKKEKSLLLKHYVIKIKTANNVASQRLKAAKGYTIIIEKNMRQNTKEATFIIDNIKKQVSSRVKDADAAMKN